MATTVTSVATTTVNKFLLQTFTTNKTTLTIDDTRKDIRENNNDVTISQDSIILTKSEFYEMALPQMNAKRYAEIYNFADTCKRKGWPFEKTCNALGITVDDIPIITEVYHESAFTIFPSDEEYSYEDEIDWGNISGVLKFEKK